MQIFSTSLFLIEKKEKIEKENIITNITNQLHQFFDKTRY